MKWSVCIKTETVEEVTVEAESYLEAMTVGETSPSKKVIRVSKLVNAREQEADCESVS